MAAEVFEAATAVGDEVGKFSFVTRNDALILQHSFYMFFHRRRASSIADPNIVIECLHNQFVFLLFV